MDGGVPDVLAPGFADQMPVNRIARQLHVLTHAIELDAFDVHLAPGHRHDVPAEVRLERIFGCLNLDVTGQ